MRPTSFISILLAAAALSGCDMLGDSAEKVAAAREADGKAIGGACRHAGRAIEDCYSLNRKADKASVFAGWRDMNDYMRENKIEAVPPQAVAARAERSEPKSSKSESESKAGADNSTDASEKRPAKSSGGKVREPKDHDS